MTVLPSDEHRNIGETSVRRPVAIAAGVGFCALLAAFSVVEWWTAGVDAAKAWRWSTSNATLMTSIRTFEDDISANGWLATTLIPPAQRFKVERLRLGNESAFAGVDGWLHYRPDVDHVKGRGFLDKGRLFRRSRQPTPDGHAIQPDPVLGITRFADQLKARGIALVVVPVPTKTGVGADTLVQRDSTGAIQNASFADFVSRLKESGVDVFLPELSGPDDYLRLDSHWTVDAMDLTAAAVATHLRKTVTLPPAEAGRYARIPREVAATGDLAVMLGSGLPPSWNRPQGVTLQEVTDNGSAWKPDPGAAVLVLGDSFSNIFSQEALGWGESAGFVEQLSFHLGLPVDRIARNDAASHATRDMLSRELSRGRDRLAGKRIVVWQFAERELSHGDWKDIPLDLGAATASDLLTPAKGEAMEVRGVVAAISAVPIPGTVPYADHIAALHLVDVGDAKAEAYVFVWSMTNQVRTAGGRLKPGDEVNIRLKNWSDVASDLESFNRSELEDEEFLLAEPCWGELNP